MTKPAGLSRKTWPFILAGSVGAFLVFLVVIGVASNGTPDTQPAAKAAAGSTAIGPTEPAPAMTPPAIAGGSLRQAHTVRTEPVDIVLTAGQCHVVTLDPATGAYLPDPVCTPGAVDTAVTEATLASTICASGYTASVRPPTSITGPAKSASLVDYGMSAGPTVEYDHLVPLELGGASTVSNLWPEPNKGTAKGVNNPKDSVENSLKRAVCDHRVPLSTAQAAIASNWTTAESVLGLG
jgi:hypothetical protein